MILPPDHVGDALVEVVDRDSEVVEGRPVRPGDHRIVEVAMSEAGLSPDGIADHSLAFVRDAEAQRPLSFRFTSEPTVRPVDLLPRPDVISGGAGSVGTSVGLE